VHEGGEGIIEISLGKGVEGLGGKRKKNPGPKGKGRSLEKSFPIGWKPLLQEGPFLPCNHVEWGHIERKGLI